MVQWDLVLKHLYPRLQQYKKIIKVLDESEVELASRHEGWEISAKETGMGICKDHRKRGVCTHINRRLPCTKQKQETETGRKTQGIV